MARGSYDAQGFYSYGEDDIADPGQGFSELLNKSTEGVKTAVPVLVKERTTFELNNDPSIRARADQMFGQLIAESGERLMRRDVSEAFGIRTGGGAPVAQFSESAATFAGDINFTGATFRSGLGLGVGVGERSPIWVDPTNGDIHMAGMIIRAGSGFRIADADERELFSTDHPSGDRPRRIVPIFVAGQSGADGRGIPFGPELDPADDRILMWDHATSGLATATVPLSSRATNARAGLSPATVIAREILAHEPAGTLVVIVNTAVGGSGLVATPTQGRWLWGAAGSLAPGAITIMRNALSTLSRAYPGVPIEMPRGFWAQGEADTNGPAYAAALPEVLTQLGAGIGHPTMTWVITGIVPEYIVRNPNRGPIRAAHMDLPRVMLRTAYEDGVSGGGGSWDVADIVHYHRPAVEVIGKRAYRAYSRAVVNVASSVPHPPLVVTRTPTGVSWEPPTCRVTGYVVETSADGGATWTALDRSAPLDPTATVTGPGLVRIATVNDVGTSAPTTPLLIGS